MNKFEMAFMPNLEKKREESDKELKEEGAIEIEDLEGGKRLELTADQIEEIRGQMEEEMSENKKFEIITNAVMNSLNQEVKEITISLNQQLKNKGADVSRISVWELMREQLSGSAGEQLSDLLKEYKLNIDENSLLSKVVSAIDKDMFGRDLVDASPEYLVADFLKENEELSEDDIKEIEDTINLLQLNGQRKFFKFNSSQQLKNIISLQEEMQKRSDNFDPDYAGYFELVKSVESGLAASQLDSNTKSSMFESIEGKRETEQCRELLQGLSQIQARQFLKTHDIEIEN